MSKIVSLLIEHFLIYCRVWLQLQDKVECLRSRYENFVMVCKAIWERLGGIHVYSAHVLPVMWNVWSLSMEFVACLLPPEFLLSPYQVNASSYNIVFVV